MSRIGNLIQPEGTIAMTKFASVFAAAALVAISASAFAEPSAPVSFTRDGASYTYTVEHKSEKRIIRGRETTSGSTFTLIVGKAYVTGFVDGKSVSFPLSAVKTQHATVDVAMASR
jgi:hypothetical protein